MNVVSRYVEIGQEGRMLNWRALAWLVRREVDTGIVTAPAEPCEELLVAILADDRQATIRAMNRLSGPKTLFLARLSDLSVCWSTPAGRPYAPFPVPPGRSRRSSTCASTMRFGILRGGCQPTLQPPGDLYPFSPSCISSGRIGQCATGAA